MCRIPFSVFSGCSLSLTSGRCVVPLRSKLSYIYQRCRTVEQILQFPSSFQSMHYHMSLHVLASEEYYRYYYYDYFLYHWQLLSYSSGVITNTSEPNLLSTPVLSLYQDRFSSPQTDFMVGYLYTSPSIVISGYFIFCSILLSYYS